MTATQTKTLISGLITLVLAAALWPRIPALAHYAAIARVHLHGPDVSLWSAQPLAIKFHIFAAALAFLIGLLILVRPKGRGLHKTFGWAWVIAMGATAISSFFIRGLNGNAFSLIHLLSGWVVVALPMALYAIRNKRVNLHRRLMTGLFVGGLVIAGGLTFIPGRLMYQLFFG
jgi:uncharacterized membrane protein